MIPNSTENFQYTLKTREVAILVDEKPGYADISPGVA
jgi:hypothetical protein